MPQLNQLPEIFWSQLFWLAVVFAIIFFAIGRGMVPKIQSTVDAREKQIADDLEAAQAARTAADRTEEAWRERMDAARGDAARIAAEAKEASARDTEAKVKAAAEKLQAKADAASADLAQSVQSARAEIEAVAVDLTQDLVGRVAGLTVDKNEAASAVKVELNV